MGELGYNIFLIDNRGGCVSDVPTVEHAKLARAGVNVTIRTANLLWFGAVTLGRAVGNGALLWDAVADGNLENVTPNTYTSIKKTRRDECLVSTRSGKPDMANSNGMNNDEHMRTYPQFLTFIWQLLA